MRVSPAILAVTCAICLLAGCSSSEGSPYAGGWLGAFGNDEWVIGQEVGPRAGEDVLVTGVLVLKIDNDGQCRVKATFFAGNDDEIEGIGAGKISDDGWLWLFIDYPSGRTTVTGYLEKGSDSYAGLEQTFLAGNLSVGAGQRVIVSECRFMPVPFVEIPEIGSGLLDDTKAETAL